MQLRSFSITNSWSWKRQHFFALAVRGGDEGPQPDLQDPMHEQQQTDLEESLASAILGAGDVGGAATRTDSNMVGNEPQPSLESPDMSTTTTTATTTTTTTESKTVSDEITENKLPPVGKGRLAFVLKDRVNSSVKHLTDLKQRMMEQPEHLPQYNNGIETARMEGPTLAILFGTAALTPTISFRSLYALALLGSSVGFYIFLYFISIGYAFGIGLPMAVALLKSNFRSLPRDTVLHASLIVLWSIRAGTFYLWREYKSWPALHEKVLQVQRTKSPPLLVKLLCWIVYSFLYVCMISPAWFRLMMMTPTTPSAPKVSAGRSHVTTMKRRSFYSGLGIVFQIVGLLVESIADWQKSAFKASSFVSPSPVDGDLLTISRRNHWCHVGLWRFSTYPNYAGEWLFWLGTLIGGVPAVSPLQRYPIQWLMMFSGFIFISVVLKGAMSFLSQKQWLKYGDNPDFVAFQKHFGVFGYRFWLDLQPRLHQLIEKLPVPGRGSITADEPETT